MFSFEFFPPKTDEARRTLERTLDGTSNAGGGTRTPDTRIMIPLL